MKAKRGYLALLALLLVITGGASGREFVLEGEGWLEGQFSGVELLSPQRGIALAAVGLSPVWEVKRTDVLVADAVVSGYAYIAGSYRAEAGAKAWLAALTPAGGFEWETWVRKLWGEDSQATAVALGPAGSLFVTGWYGNALLLSRFTEQGKELWSVYWAQEDGTLLGTDVAVVGNAVFVTATEWHGDRTEGVLLRYSLEGDLQWELHIPGSTEATALGWDGQGVQVLCNGPNGWFVAAVSQDGEVLGPSPCPADFKPVNFVTLGDSVGVAGISNGHLSVRTLACEERVSLPMGSLSEVKSITVGPSGDVAASGWTGSEGLLVFWRLADGSGPLEVVLPGQGIRPLVVSPMGDGHWLVLSTERGEENATSHLAMWLTPPLKRIGTYTSTLFNCPEGEVLSSLKAEIDDASAGSVEIRLIVYKGDTAVPSIYTFQPEGEGEISLGEIGPCKRFRVTVVISSRGQSSPAIRRIAITTGLSSSSSLTPPQEPPETIASPKRREPGDVDGADDRSSPAFSVSTEVGIAGKTAFSFWVSQPGEAGGGAWDFGDGLRSRGTKVQHVYTSPGIFTVTYSAESEDILKRQVKVYGLRYKHSAVLMYFPDDVVLPGDFNGGGCSDAVLWSKKSSTLFLLLGVCDGTFQFLSNVDLAKGVDSMAVADVNGDGRDDLLVWDRDKGEVFWFPGAPVGLLAASRQLHLELDDLRILHCYPPLQPGKVAFVGSDAAGQPAVVWLRADGGELKVVSRVSPHRDDGGLWNFSLEKAAGSMALMENGAWADFSASPALPAAIGAGAVIGSLGDFDGDGLADVLAREAARAVVYLSAGGTVDLGSWGKGDIWLSGRFAGDSPEEQIVRVNLAGTHATFHFLGSYKGSFDIPVPFAPVGAFVVPTPSGPSDLFLVSQQGEAIWVELVSLRR